jgi:tetratricopeptide (TPR) repeat protein
MSQIMAEKALGFMNTPAADPAAQAALDKEKAGTHNNLGLTWLKRGEEREAVERFKEALSLEPDNLESNLNLGYIALGSGDYGLASDCFKRATEKSPSNVDALLGLAVSQRGANDLDAAEKTYKQIIKLDPKNELAYFDASVLHEKYTKDFKKAGSYLQAYVTEMGAALPSDHEVHTRIARVEQSRAEEEARKAAEAARKREEEERRKRNEELLAQMKVTVDGMQAKLTTNVACIPEETAAELAMIVEQANVVITEKDTDLAGDIQSLIKDYAQPMLETALAEHCSAASAPAPAPTEGAPADGAPAEGAAPADGSAPTPAPAEPAPAPAEPTPG